MQQQIYVAGDSIVRGIVGKGRSTENNAKIPFHSWDTPLHFTDPVKLLNESQKSYAVIIQCNREQVASRISWIPSNKLKYKIQSQWN